MYHSLLLLLFVAIAAKSTTKHPSQHHSLKRSNDNKEGDVHWNKMMLQQLQQEKSHDVALQHQKQHKLDKKEMQGKQGKPMATTNKNSSVPRKINMQSLDTRIRVSSPDSTALCMNQWHTSYASMHARAAAILRRVPSKDWTPELLEKEGVRAFIYIAREGVWEKIKSGGVADRFSLVGMFAMCLAHNTAFFIDYPGISDVFDTGSGQLSWSVDATGYINKHGYANSVLHFPDLFQGKHHCTRWHGNLVCRNLTLDNHIANSSLTIARTARGKITVMFKDDYYSRVFRQLGVEYGKYVFCFRCARCFS